MKTNYPTLLTTAALAVGAFLLLAPNSHGAAAKPPQDSFDTKFLQEEIAAGVALVKLAKLGETQANDAEVRAFAATIATDHTKTNAELATLAQSKEIQVTSEFDSQHASNYEKLEGETGADFDKEFLAVVISDHKKSVKNFEAAAEEAEDSQVKQWAADMLPKLRAHLARAEELRSDPTVKADAAFLRIDVAESDNTARRDRNIQPPTPINQGNSKTDIDQ